jgi:predicted  nucleic acid-binding Zn-ribbon protein
MPLGIDVEMWTIHLATPQGTTRHSNAIRRASDDETPPPEEAITIEIDDETYVVAGEGDGDPDYRLFGDTDDTPAAVQTEAAEAFLASVVDRDDTDAADRLRYVANGAAADTLATVATGAGYEATPVDAGMAVSYTVLDAPATGLGISITDERVVATLAAAGVPVATTRLDLDGDWFDLGRDGSSVTDGPSSDWLARQYETLFADLGHELVRSAPALEGPVTVAIGGSGAPAGEVDRLAEALAATLPFEVGSATVAEDPDTALARGALAAATADDGVEAPRPAFAADVPFVGGLADFRAATDTLGAGAKNATPLVDGSDGPAAGQASSAALATLDRRGAMTARGVSDLADRLEAGDAASVDSFRANLESLESRLPDEEALETLEGDLSEEIEALGETVETIETDLDSLDDEAASASTVADLEASLESLDAAVADLERDAEAIRAAITGLDADTDLEAPEVSGEGVDSLRADALQEDIEAVETDLADRIGGVWDELDELEGRLVDVEASADAVPDLESSVTSTRNAVVDLEEETDHLQEVVASFRADLESVGEETPSTAAVESIEADLERLADDVESLRQEVESTDRVDPAAVEGLEKDLDALRQTLITRADRMESLEDTAENLRERIETVYQNTAKSEALASLETETARIRQTAGEAMERANEMTETVSQLRETVDEHDQQLGMISTNVDNLAGNSVTRPEMDAAIDKVEDRLDGTEADIRSELDAVRQLVEDADGGDVEPIEQEGSQELVVILQAVAFVALGVFGALLAVQVGSVLVAGGFLVFSIMPGVLSWLVS